MNLDSPESFDSLAECRQAMKSKLPSTKCPVCNHQCIPLDVVDFNKSCEELRGKYLPLSGVPIYYHICGKCGFAFAPEFQLWQLDDFEREIYNSDYSVVDPDYLDVRPRANAENMAQMFGDQAPEIRHLDYGGGNGMLSDLLRGSGWNTTSYDPFVERDIRPEELGQFDLITAFEVFEHVPNVSRLMAHLSQLLAPAGLVLFSTLLSDGNILPRQRLSWWYASPRNGHISLFSQHSLVILASRAGLNFGSFSSGVHVFWRAVPPWARHILPDAQSGT